MSGLHSTSVSKNRHKKFLEEEAQGNAGDLRKRSSAGSSPSRKRGSRKLEKEPGFLLSPK